MYLLPANESIQSKMRGNGNASFFVTAFNFQKSKHHLTPPSFFRTKTGGKAHGDTEGCITPASSSSLNPLGTTLLNLSLCRIGGVSSLSKLIQWGVALKQPKSKSCAENTCFWTPHFSHLSFPFTFWCRHLISSYNCPHHCSGFHKNRPVRIIHKLYRGKLNPSWMKTGWDKAWNQNPSSFDEKAVPPKT